MSRLVKAKVKRAVKLATDPVNYCEISVARGYSTSAITSN